MSLSRVVANVSSERGFCPPIASRGVASASRGLRLSQLKCPARALIAARALPTLRVGPAAVAVRRSGICFQPCRRAADRPQRSTWVRARVSGGGSAPERQPLPGSDPANPTLELRPARRPDDGADVEGCSGDVCGATKLWRGDVVRGGSLDVAAPDGSPLAPRLARSAGWWFRCLRWVVPPSRGVPAPSWPCWASVLAGVWWMSSFNMLARTAVPRGLRLVGLNPHDPSPLVQVARHLALDALQLGNVALMFRALRAAGAWSGRAELDLTREAAELLQEERAGREKDEEERLEGEGSSGLSASLSLSEPASVLVSLPPPFEALRVPLEALHGIQTVLLGILSFPLLESAHRVATSAWTGVEAVEVAGSGGGRAALGASALMLWTIVLSFAAPAWEEALFRGLLLSSIKGAALATVAAGRAATALASGTRGVPSSDNANTSPRHKRASFACIDALSIALSAMAFAFAHGGAPEALSTLFLLGGVLGWVRVASGRIWPAAVVHAAWNLHLLARLWRGG